AGLGWGRCSRHARAVRRGRSGSGRGPLPGPVRLADGGDPVERVIRRDAHAKINVYLRVLGRREDGYHDIESLVLPVSLADEVRVRAGLELRLTVSGELAGLVPLDESNLVVRAARALAAAAGVDAGADIELEKRIPVAAGLGGGSGDAAAALLALSELWGAELGTRILEVAGEVG